MSKHKTKAGRRAQPEQAGNRLPIALIAGTVVGVGVLVIVFISALSSTTTPSLSATNTTAITPGVSAGAPKLEVAQDTIDHGTVRFNTMVQSVFRLRNTGDGDLLLSGNPRVELVEGC